MLDLTYKAKYKTTKIKRSTN